MMTNLLAMVAVAIVTNVEVTVERETKFNSGYQGIIYTTDGQPAPVAGAQASSDTFQNGSLFWMTEGDVIASNVVTTVERVTTLEFDWHGRRRLEKRERLSEMKKRYERVANYEWKESEE